MLPMGEEVRGGTQSARRISDTKIIVQEGEYRLAGELSEIRTRIIDQQLIFRRLGLH
jgi:hypothetical protein